MRLPKADSHRISIAFIITLFIASVLCLCIFCVSGGTIAEVKPYEEMVSDYHVFKKPTCIAACAGAIAVFDEGDVVLFRKGEKSIIHTQAEDCDKLCVASSAVVLLRGTGLGSDPEISVYSFTGEKMAYEIPAEGVTDIAYYDSVLYTLAYVEVKGYAVADGQLRESWNLPASYGSLAFDYADDGSIWFSAIRGGVFRRKGGENEVFSYPVDSSVKRFRATLGHLYFEKSGSIYRDNEPFLYCGGAGDVAFSTVTDLATDGGTLYVLDAGKKAIKAYDVATKTFVKMIGSYGSDGNRLTNPVAIGVKGGRVVVADDVGVTVLSEGTRSLKGDSTSRTDLAIAGEKVYLSENGKVQEYASDFLKIAEYGVAGESLAYLASTPDGTVYASSGKKVFRKKAAENVFSAFLTMDRQITGLTVGIGGKILYVECAGTIRACSKEDGSRLWDLSTDRSIASFVVDHRGNIFALSGNKVIAYTRTVGGYGDPVEYPLPSAYARYVDMAADTDGALYLIADHNVLVYPKTYFNVQIAEDSTFKDEVPSVSPRFICEVVTDSAIAYTSPDNFEDIATVARGTKLMCYASVQYGADEFVRVETEKGTAYIPKGEVKVYSNGTAPVKKARCLLPAVGTRVVGVNIYEEPSYLAIEKGTEPLFKALGKEDVFDVVDIVAVEDGKDVWGFYRVLYQETTGYVRINEVVSVDDEPQPMPPTYSARIKSDGLGKTVAVYKEANTESEEIARLSDGTEVSLLEPLDYDKEFISVLYEGEVYYVLSANLGQGGLSGGQVLAIVLSVVAVVGSVLTVLIMRANKKHRRRQKE